ncbi:MAG: hypothetical protein ACREQJ_02195 [Candidatus Binatia bacterium]
MQEAATKGRTPEFGQRLSVGFLLAGDHWRIDFLSESFYLRDSKGLRYLLLLTENPGRKFTLDQVAAAGEIEPAQERPLTPEELFRNRLHEIRTEMQVATDQNDLGRRLWMQMEVERMADQLDPREAAPVDAAEAESVERSRKSIGNSIRRTIAAIGKYSPLLAGHLSVSVRTGGSLSYVPDPLTGIRWRRDRIFEGWTKSSAA